MAGTKFKKLGRSHLAKIYKNRADVQLIGISLLHFGKFWGLPKKLKILVFLSVTH